ncbi:MAG: hypothetical protein J0H35_06325, partial [Rhodospirillales bacterium]|nr:hypothetical protein [Rhodospirillales bacterium]
MPAFGESAQYWWDEMTNQRANPLLAVKLRLTAAVLGCSSHKELCARFRAVNPATHCAVDRLNKWLQGRAMPRSVGLYDDWAKLLRTSRSAGWIATCSVEAFVAELATLFDADPARLLATEREVTARFAQSRSKFGYMLGAYACYSLAWSPYDRGMIIRATLEVSGEAGGGLEVRYLEQVLGGAICFTGELHGVGRTMGGLLIERATQAQAYLHLFTPGPPAGALCGLLAGATYVGQDPQPAAGRILLVRVPDGAPCEAGNRYLAPDRGAVAADLQALGITGIDLAAADSVVLAFLTEPQGAARDLRVPSEMQEQLGAIFDAAVRTPSPPPALA